VAVGLTSKSYDDGALSNTCADREVVIAREQLHVVNIQGSNPGVVQHGSECGISLVSMLVCD
jgi:hypothetical protein